MNKKVLVIGPPGSGKTYLSTDLRKLGLNAIDAELIDGLSSWYDRDGNKTVVPEHLSKEFLSNHFYFWNRKFIEDYLHKNPDIYLFGSFGNLSDVFDLFDKVYFLKVEPEILMERLTHRSRKNNRLGETENQRQNTIKWAQQLEEIAKKQGVKFIDATLSPKKIYDLIK